MSMQPVTSADAVPAWDLADRLRKSLRHANVGVQEMAEYLEASRHTIGNWINGHTRPRPSDLKQWALRCGVSYDWLSTGRLPRVDSNHQPAGWDRDHENVQADRPMTEDEVVASQRDWRGLIRRGTFDLLADGTSTGRPIAHSR